MPATKGHAAFLKAIRPVAATGFQGPLNSAAIARDKSLGLQKASSLLGYQNYLARARAWKAGQKASTPTFERGVLAQATQALGDARDLAAATLRVAGQMRHAGALDQTLNNWINALKESGPVQVKDLWNGLANDASVREMLAKHGVTDELFAPIGDVMAKLNGPISARNGKLSAQISFESTNQVMNAMFSVAPAGKPKNLDDLLKRGQFERLVAQFNNYGACSIPLVPCPPADLELSDVLLAGAVLGVQTLAQHVRNLQDVGLSTYAGAGPLAGWVLVALVVSLIGYGMANATCPDGHDHNTTECVIGVILAVLGGIALAVLLGLWAYALAAVGNNLGVAVLFTLVLAVGSEIASH
jgi:hypothetical protein